MEDQGILNPEVMVASDASSSKKKIDCSSESSMGKNDNECPVCQIGFATNGSMMRHNRSVHKDIKKWKCDPCGKRYTSSQSLIDHKVKHSDSDRKPWKCEELNCIQAYANPQKLKLHRQKLHTKTQDMIQCQHCDNKFIFKAQLRLHQYQVHTNAEVGNEAWHKIEQVWRKTHCKYCGRNSRNCTKNHEGILHRFSCEQCILSFIKGPELRSHILDQHKETEVTKKHLTRWDEILGIETIGDEDQAICTSASQMESTETDPAKEYLLKRTLETKPYENVYEEDSVDDDDTNLSDKDFSPPCETIFVSEANKEGTFPCDQCKANFSIKDELRYHKLIQHEGLRFQCRTCKQLFTEQMERKDHISFCFDSKELLNKDDSEVDSNVEDADCMKDDNGIVQIIKREGIEKDQEDIKEKGALKTELDRVDIKPENKVISKDESLGSSNKTMLKSEYEAKQEHDREKWSCNQCIISFSQRDNLMYHIEKVHQHERFMIGQNKDELMCDECVYKTTRKYSLKLHKEFNHEGITFNCNQCPFSVSRMNLLKRHEREMHSGNNFLCDQCDFLTYSQNKLKRHTKHHIEPENRAEPKYQSCDHCDYATYMPSLLRKHTMKHLRVSSSARYYCKECDSSYAEKKGLADHVKVKHMGINYQCKHCVKFYNSKKDLKFHNQQKHVNIKVPCDVCTQIYPTSIELLRHKRKVHNGNISGIIGIFPCKQCDYVATRMSTLKNHNQAKHKEEKFACWFCGHKANCIQSLRWHLGAKHPLQSMKSPLSISM